MTASSTRIELTSVADLPANSGLGSSSSFTVALLNALHTYKREFVSCAAARRGGVPHRDRAPGEPIGKQDQYIAAFGSVTAFTFNTDGTRRGRARARCGDEVLDELETNLRHLLVRRRAAGERRCCREQGKRIRATRARRGRAHAHASRTIGHEVTGVLVEGDIDALRRAAPRALDAEAQARLEDDRLRDRRALRGRARGGRHRRQADGRGRRRLLHVLHAARRSARRVRGAGQARPAAAPLSLRSTARASSRTCARS